MVTLVASPIFRTLVDQLVQWAIQALVRLAILIGAGLVALFAGISISIRLSRWISRSLLQFSVWLVATAWDVTVDAIRRWRSPDVSDPSRPDGDESKSTPAVRETASDHAREYLRIRPRRQSTTSSRSSKHSTGSSPIIDGPR
jgi:hypothetical protein